MNMGSWSQCWSAMWILFGFGHDMKGGRWVRKGGGMGYTTFCAALITNGGAFSRQTQQHTYHPMLWPSTVHNTQCCTCKERHGDVSSSSYSANSTSGRAKLQQPHQQGDAQAHMIRRSLPELSNLWCSSEAILPNRLPMSGNRTL